MDTGGPLARYLLVVSGLVGLTAGLGIEWYRLILVDPIVGGGDVPDWLETLRTALLAGSIAVFIYGLVIEELFEAALGYVVIGGLLAQWGLAMMVLLEGTAGGLRSMFGYFVLVFGALHVVIAGTVAVTYALEKRPERLSGGEQPETAGPADERATSPEGQFAIPAETALTVTVETDAGGSVTVARQPANLPSTDSEESEPFQKQGSIED